MIENKRYWVRSADGLFVSWHREICRVVRKLRWVSRRCPCVPIEIVYTAMRDGVAEHVEIRIDRDLNVYTISSMQLEEWIEQKRKAKGYAPC